MIARIVPLSKVRHFWTLYLFALPAIVLVGLFQYYPALSGVFYSFFRWNGADIREFIGFENYTTLAGKSDFWRSFRVALVIGLWNVVKMIPALAVAICIHRCRSQAIQFLYRASFIIPMVLPSLVVVLVWRTFFFDASSGYLNRFLSSVGMLDILPTIDRILGLGGIFQEGRRPAWLGDGRLLLFSAISWGFPWVGSFAVLIYLAKLQSIPKELYEAADIDGASWFSKCTGVELPMLLGSIGLQLIFVVIGTLKDAGTILALAGVEGGPGGVVSVPALFMFREAFIKQQLGAACAVGITLTIIVISLKHILDLVLQWEDLRTPARIGLRLVGVGGAVFAWAVLDSPLLAGVVSLTIIPWSLIIARLPALPELRRRESAIREDSAVKQFMLRSSKHGVVLFVLALAYLPLYLMLVVSFKDNQQFYAAPASLTFPLHWENWSNAWNIVLPSLANSIFVVMFNTVIALIVALAAAYFFARVQLPGSRLLWNALFVLLALPEIANLVPLFRLLRDLNLLNSLFALILVGSTAGQAVAIVWLRNFIADIPQELIDAADVDGASQFRQLFVIVLPLTAPILGVIGVMHAIGQWNELLLPLVVMQDDSKLPVMVQLLRMNGEYVKFWGPLMAGYVLASVPIVFLFVASIRLFSRGLTDGAVKA